MVLVLGLYDPSVERKMRPTLPYMRKNYTKCGTPEGENSDL